MCPLNLVKWAVPVIRGDVHIGTVIAGCVRLNNLDLSENTVPQQYAFLDLSWETFRNYWNKIPYRSSQQIHYVAQQLFYMVCYCMETDQTVIQKGQKRSAEQRVLYEEIAQRKHDRSKNIAVDSSVSGDRFQNTEESPLGLTAQDEKELVGRIQLSDQTGMKKILNKALGKILLSNTDNLYVIKVLLIELIVSVGRAATQRKNGGTALFAFYQTAIDELSGIDNLNQICRWTAGTVDSLAALLMAEPNAKKFSTVEQIALYIKENYWKNLKLEDIAGIAGYSPYHISRLFKDELGMTIVDYITEVRIIKAKELLENPDLSIEFIAESVGYQYPHYFARIFKKQVGISPSEYRRWWSEK